MKLDNYKFANWLIPGYVLCIILFWGVCLSCNVVLQKLVSPCLSS